jgi:mutator protein MutT
MMENKSVKLNANIVIEKEGKYLLARIDKGRLMTGKWTFPGGSVEFGEDFHTTIKRELNEELGITDVKINKFLGIVEIIRPERHMIINVFLGRLGDTGITPVKGETSEYKFFTKDEIKALQDKAPSLDVISNLIDNPGQVFQIRGALFGH